METPRRDHLGVCIHANLYNSVNSPLVATLVPTVTSVGVATSPYTTGLTALNVTTRLATILAIAIVPLVIGGLGRGAHPEVISVRIEAGNGGLIGSWE